MYEVRNRLAGNLSRGMLQKLSLAVTIIHDPEVIILDEPTLGLDVYAKRELLDLIQKLAKEKKKTILLTSHQLEIVEQIVDRVIIIDKGKVITDEQKDILKKLYSKNIIQVITSNKRQNDLDILTNFPHLIGKEENEHKKEIIFNFLFDDKDMVFGLLKEIVQNKIVIKGIYEKELSIEDVFILLTNEVKSDIFTNEV